jgi:ATP:ADP antiporter, AAA family
MDFSGVKKVLAGLVDVRREELPRILPLTLAYGLVMASLYVLKPARNALFLDQLGVAQLPYVLMLVALIGGGVAAVFTRLIRLIRLDRLILGTFLFLMINLLGFRLLLPYGWGWSFYLFYVWVNLYGLMATSLLWLLAGVIFNPREARRLFGLIGSAGIAGAIVGGAFTSWVVTQVGTENLLIVCVALLGGGLLLLLRVRSGGEVSPREEKKSSGALADIGRSDLLQLLGSMAALTAVVAAVIDVQFNDIVDRAFADKDAKTAFFGQFFAYLSGFAFLFQIWCTPRILRSLGVVSALLFLPLSMALGSVAVLFAPGLAAGILLKIGDGGFRHSLHKSAVEILFLPIPAAVKQRTKVLLDTTVDNLATGIGALLVLVLTAVLGVSYQHLGFVSLALVGLWVGLVIRGRGAYVDAFRQALDRRAIDLGELTVEVDEAAALDSLIASLDSGNERQVVYALDMLISLRSRRLARAVRPLLQHRAAEVRQKSIRVLCNQAEELPVDEIEGLLQDEVLEVRVEALYCMCRQDEGGIEMRLREALQSGDPKLRSAAVGCIAAHGTEAGELVDDAFVEELLADRSAEGEDNRVQVARILGNLDRPEWRLYLRQLLEDSSPRVVEQAIGSLGAIRDPEQIGWLLDRLGDRQLRRAARQALAAYGPAVLPALRRCLLDKRVDPVVRTGVTRVLSDIRSQEVVDLLLEDLDAASPWLEHLMIKALSRLRQGGGSLFFEPRRVEEILARQVEAYYQLFEGLQLYQSVDGEAPLQLLQKVLREKQAQVQERIFRLLGLLYPPQDMHRAYLGLVSGQARLRASALEFLDNVLQRRVKEQLLPLLDPPTAESALAHGEELFGHRLQERERALEWLLGNRDSWLRACAAYSAIEIGSEEQIELVRRAADDPNRMVREAVERVLSETGSQGGEGY